MKQSRNYRICMARTVLILTVLTVLMFSGCPSPTSTQNLSVTYDGNGADGTPPMDRTPYFAGTHVILPGAGNLKYPGKSFNGWNTQKDGTGQSQKKGSEYMMGKTSVTFYAQWVPETLGVLALKIDYDGNAITNDKMPIDNHIYRNVFSITVEAPGMLDREGHSFTGWNTKRNGSGTTYQEGDTLNVGDLDKPVVRLYAQWEKTQLKDLPTVYTTTSSVRHGSIDTSNPSFMATGPVTVGGLTLDKPFYEDLSVIGYGAHRTPTEKEKLEMNISRLEWDPSFITYRHVLNKKDKNDKTPFRAVLSSTTTPMDITVPAVQIQIANFIVTLDLMPNGELFIYSEIIKGKNNKDKRVRKKIMENVFQVVAGVHHAMILKYDGTLWALLGRYEQDQINIDGFEETLIPVKIAEDISLVSAGISLDTVDTMILGNNGKLWAVGVVNEIAQLGDGTTKYQKVSKEIMKDVAAMYTEKLQTTVLKNDGSFWFIGYPKMKNKPTKVRKESLHPSLVEGLERLSQIKLK